MSVPFPEPTVPAGSEAEVFTRYLDYFRDRAAAKLRRCPPASCGAPGSRPAGPRSSCWDT